ncbi:MAG TPA: MATE family efflux transporter, partial [Dysgonamonadaceae bacterium]|nr:MATE family efflux transporter [Dysgonamonadaceae bacterium]
MMGIAFFSSRVLLRELGVNDFGIYGVVGGVVAMFGSLRGIFASSIQRFLNFEMGRGNNDKLKRIFSIGVTIHILLSVVFLILAETVGLWFLNNKLVIQPDRLIAANWVYQFSVAASIVTLMTIPYDAVIIANERMKAFAYISILDAILKLGIIFLISFFGNDKLIFYGLLILIVSILTRSVNMIYSQRNFEESKYKFIWDKNLFKQIGGFAGWNFLGNTAYTFSNEGVNILLNIFGGTPVNAARAIAYQVRSVTTQFTSNILMAVNPHLIKLYSQKQNEKFTELLFFISKTTFFVMLILCLPIILFADTVLTLWLVNVPEYTVVFVKLILVFLMIRIFHSPIDTLFKATGRIKVYQIIETATLFLTLPLSYILLKNNFGVQSVFVVMIFVEIINLIAILYLAQRMGELNISNYLLRVILPCFFVTIIAAPTSYILINSLHTDSIFM